MLRLKPILALPALIACQSVGQTKESALGTVCEQVHTQVLGMHAASIGIDATEAAQKEQSRCETLTVEEQEVLLRSAKLARITTAIRVHFIWN